MKKRIALPAAVVAIYRAVEQLRSEYPDRSFTPDGHLVGHIGEVIAAKEFKLHLLPNSHPCHDATDALGHFVQIKLTAGKSIAMYADCDRLIVLRITSPEWAEVFYDSDGAPIWQRAGKLQKNGQRPVRLKAIEDYQMTLAPQ